MKKIIPVLLLFIFTYNGFGQYKTHLVPHSSDPEIKKIVVEATKYLSGSDGYNKDYLLAKELLEQAAKKDEPVAQFLLGQIYEHGKGVKVHLQKAYKYYELSAKNGEKEAMLKLGDFNKMGKGVKLDFKKAAWHFYKSSDLDSPRGNYALGYMHFKGFGVEQDYEKAYYLFVRGAQKRFPPAMFMLGICYEQGFFVEEELQKALDCYKYAASRNYKQAQVRLDQLKLGKQKSLKIEQNGKLHSGLKESGLIPKHFKKVDTRHENDLLLNGEWEGQLLIYDWSGKEILESQTVNLSVKQDNYTIDALWDSDMTHTSSKGFIQGNKVNFNKLNLVTDDAFGGYTHKCISDLTLNVSHKNGYIYLSGNITSSIPSDKEPGAPGFIILRQAVSTNQINASTGNNSDSKSLTNERNLNFNVYPNPFDNKIQVEFEIKEAGNVSVFMYNASGERIKEIKDDVYYLPGKYSLNFNVQVAPGAYIIGVEQNNVRQTRKLIKK